MMWLGVLRVAAEPKVWEDSGPARTCKVAAPPESNSDLATGGSVTSVTTSIPSLRYTVRPPLVQRCPFAQSKA